VTTADTTPIVVRAMRPEDAQSVGTLTLAAYDAYGSIGGDYRAYLADPQRRVAGASAVYVAELAGRVVGTVTYVVHGDREWEGRRIPDADAAFRVLAVDPEVEGAGVGRALVTACIDRARREGRHRLVITSMSWMDRAHALYERLDFVRRPDLDVRFPGGFGRVFTLDLTDEAPDHFPPPGAVPAEPPWFEDVWAT
jgi:GNAT superfamily N-acetyltransferase